LVAWWRLPALESRPVGTLCGSFILRSNHLEAISPSIHANENSQRKTLIAATEQGAEKVFRVAAISLNG